MESSDRQDVSAKFLLPIIYYVLAQYLDDIIVGPRALDLNFDATLMSTVDMLYERETTGMKVQMEHIRSLENPVPQLLRASHTIRQIALEALAKILNVRYIDEGLGRLEGEPMWRTLCLARYDAWWAANSIEPPPEPPDESDAPSRSPVLATYLATVILQREARLVWGFLDAPDLIPEDNARVLGPWQLPIVERWARYATSQLTECSEPFRHGALRQRVYAALVDASIAELFGVFLHHLQEALRGVRRVRQYAVNSPFGVGTVTSMWTDTLSDIATNLLRLLEAVPASLAKLDDLPRAALGPTTETVDELIGQAKYVTLIGALAGIADMDLESPVYERCRSEARALCTIFSQRLDKLSR